MMDKDKQMNTSIENKLPFDFLLFHTEAFKFHSARSLVLLKSKQQ